MKRRASRPKTAGLVDLTRDSCDPEPDDPGTGTVGSLFTCLTIFQ
jgi:hypothetical protein